MNRPWSQIHPARAPDPIEQALVEIDVAIALVQRGQARRVRLVGLDGGRAAAALGLARAQAAGVKFALERNPASGDAVSLVIGPAIDD